MILDKPLRVLTVVAELDKGGTARGACAFASKFKSQGGDSRVCVIHSGGIRETQLEAEGIIVLSLERFEADLNIGIWEPDVIHLHSHGLTKATVMHLRSLCPQARMVETNIFSILSEWEDLLDVSFQLSNWGLRHYIKQGPKNQCEVLRYPVLDKDIFQPSCQQAIDDWKQRYGIGTDDIVIGRIGQAYSGKWSCHLISIFESLCRLGLGIKLVVVNPPPNIIRRIEASNFRGRVIAIDTIESDIELATCYSCMDIFVHVAEQGESYGLVLQESILCGTPVITLETPWADNAQKEHLDRRDCSYSVRTRRELVERLVFLAKNKTARIAMGRKGRESLLVHYQNTEELLRVAGNRDQAIASCCKDNDSQSLLLRQRAAMFFCRLGAPTIVVMACIGFVDVVSFKIGLGRRLFFSQG